MREPRVSVSRRIFALPECNRSHPPFFAPPSRAGRRLWSERRAVGLRKGANRILRLACASDSIPA